MSSLSLSRRIKLGLARVLHPIERRIDAIKARPSGRVALTSHDGFQIRGGAVLRGRVLAARPDRPVRSGGSRWANARDFMALFATDEIAGQRIEVLGSQIETTSDEEGYFELTLPDEIWGGREMVEIRADSPEAAPVPIRVHRIAPTARHMVISDIDDTMMHTGAYSLMLNLWNSVTSGAQQRHVFPDAIALMDLLGAGGSPIYYVSSSPWNLHGYLRGVFARHGLKEGPMFLRDLGLGRDQFITGTHGDHKGGAIQRILDTAPELPAILIGDTGQHDPAIYAEIMRANPGRIERVILREMPGAMSDENRAAIEALRLGEAALHLAPDYATVIAALRQAA